MASWKPRHGRNNKLLLTTTHFEITTYLQWANGSCLVLLAVPFFEFEGWPKTCLYQLIFQLSHAVMGFSSMNFSLRSWSVMLQVDHRSLLDSHISESVKLNHQVCSCQILNWHLPLLHNKLAFPVFHLSLHWKGSSSSSPNCARNVDLRGRTSHRRHRGRRAGNICKVRALGQS